MFIFSVPFKKSLGRAPLSSPLFLNSRPSRFRPLLFDSPSLTFLSNSRSTPLSKEKEPISASPVCFWIVSFFCLPPLFSASDFCLAEPDTFPSQLVYSSWGFSLSFPLFFEVIPVRDFPIFLLSHGGHLPSPPYPVLPLGDWGCGRRVVSGSLVLDVWFALGLSSRCRAYF